MNYLSKNVSKRLPFNFSIKRISTEINGRRAYEGSNLEEPFKGDKKRSAYEMQSSELPTLKKTRVWYKKIHSTVLQQNLRRLNTAFKNFFDGRRYPKFKTRQRFKSFSYSPNQVKLNGNKIYLPSIGWMRFFESRTIPEGFSLRSVTVRQKADGWYVAIQKYLDIDY